MRHNVTQNVYFTNHGSDQLSHVWYLTCECTMDHRFSWGLYNVSIRQIFIFQNIVGNLFQISRLIPVQQFAKSGKEIVVLNHHHQCPHFLSPSSQWIWRELTHWIPFVCRILNILSIFFNSKIIPYKIFHSPLYTNGSEKLVICLKSHRLNSRYGDFFPHYTKFLASTNYPKWKGNFWVS